MQDMKMQDVRMKDQVARHENAGQENAGHENARHKTLLANGSEMRLMFKLQPSLLNRILNDIGQYYNVQNTHVVNLKNVLHFHVLHFHALQFGPSFSCPAFSAPPTLVSKCLRRRVLHWHCPLRVAYVYNTVGLTSWPENSALSTVTKQIAQLYCVRSRYLKLAIDLSLLLSCFSGRVLFSRSYDDHSV